MVPPKIERKWNIELVELHKRCIVTYLSLKGVSYINKKRFLLLYDHEISEYNIRQYYTRPIHLFVRAIVRDELDKISDNIKRPRKCTKKKSKYSL